MNPRFGPRPNVILAAFNTRAGRFGRSLIVFGYMLIVLAIALRGHGDAGLIAMIVAGISLAAGFIVTLINLIGMAIALGGEHID